MGACAIPFRQTNVIWCGYFLALNIISDFQKQKFTSQKKKSRTKEFKELFDFVNYCFRNIKSIILTYYSFLALLVAFVVFLVINRGVVVGDRSAHSMSLHFPQLLYFFSFSSSWLFWHVISTKEKIKNLILWDKLNRNHVLICIGILFIFTYFVHEFTYVQIIFPIY